MAPPSSKPAVDGQPGQGTLEGPGRFGFTLTHALQEFLSQSAHGADVLQVGSRGSLVRPSPRAHPLSLLACFSPNHKMNQSTHVHICTKCQQLLCSHSQHCTKVALWEQWWCWSQAPHGRPHAHGTHHRHGSAQRQHSETHSSCSCYRVPGHPTPAHPTDPVPILHPLPAACPCCRPCSNCLPQLPAAAAQLEQQQSLQWCLGGCCRR